MRKLQEMPSVAQDPVAWLYGLQHFGMKLGLDSVSTLLKELGSPERAFPSVLVGGTNGKGSVAAMLAALLQASGVRTGLYTSPHLVRPNERIRIAGADIGSRELDRRLIEIRRTIDLAVSAGRLDAPPSFFEVLTALALGAFADEQVGAAILEVGLGGRLDATNAVEAEVSVIVSVDLDHTSVLGDTVERIATEKAGIVKAGRPLVSGVVRQSALTVIQHTCRERQAPFVDARGAVGLEALDGRRYSLRGREREYRDLELSIEGRHQVDNSRIALAALETVAPVLGVVPDPEAVRRALGSIRWPGRLQWVPAGAGFPRLLLDGAHNEAGIQTLAAHLDHEGLRPAALVFGATEGRPAIALLAPLASRVDRLVLTRPPVAKAQDPAAIEPLARALFSSVEIDPDPRSALERAAAATERGGFVLVSGSLYLVGAVLGALSADEAPGPVAL